MNKYCMKRNVNEKGGLGMFILLVTISVKILPSDSDHVLLDLRLDFACFIINACTNFNFSNSSKKVLSPYILLIAVLASDSLFFRSSHEGDSGIVKKMIS